MRDLFACAASRSLYMDAEGPRDGARCADGRFAELCCADVARCTGQRLVLPKAARALYTASML